MTRKSFSHRPEKATDLLGIIHTDVCGLHRHVSRQGASYFITFTDDYSHYRYIYLLKHKHEVFETFKVFKNEVENQLGKTIKALRSDRGGVYISQEFKDYLKACGIVQQLTPPYTPQHNGVSERRNQSATRILNMVPTKKVDKTPYELWYGKVPNLSYLKVWGCEALVKRDTLDKLQQRSVKCIFLGYPKETMGYYFYFPPENKIVVTRYAEFFEKNLITQEVSGRAIDIKEIQDEDTSPYEITSKIPIEVEGFEPPQEEVIPIRRSERTHRAPDRLCLNVESMIDNMVWVLVDLPPGCKTVGSKWIFKKNTDMDGIVHTYKPRLVAKVYTQLYGIDYEETFSPVADIRAIRILISITAFYDYEIWKMDVKTAFLYGYLDEDIYMVQHEGFVDHNHPRKASESNVTFLILYVDDIIIMGNHIPSLQSVKDYLGKCFAIKDLGEAAFILEIKIYRDRSKRLIGLGQNAYMDKILKRYKIDNFKRGHIPMQEKLDLNRTQGASTPKEVKRMQNVPYASAVVKPNTMDDRCCFETLDRSLWDILDTPNAFFGGSSIAESYLRRHFKLCRLKENTRLSKASMNEAGREKLRIPDDENGLLNLIKFIYDDHTLQHPTPQELQEKVIICPKNDVVDVVNAKVMSMIPGTPHVYQSYDEALPHGHDVGKVELLYPREYLNTLSFAGLPPHKLELKIGTPIILLRNINIVGGHCNRTHLIVKQLLPKVIEAQIVTGTRIGQKVYLLRIPLTKKDPKIPFIFKRKQFPIKICYAMTINKSQRQSFNKIGVMMATTSKMDPSRGDKRKMIIAELEITKVADLKSTDSNKIIEGTAIQANMDVTDTRYFGQLLQLDATYRISGFSCEKTPTWERTLHNDTSLICGRYLQIHNIPNDNFPHHYFDFAAYNELAGRANVRDAVLTDYIGRIRAISGISAFPPKKRDSVTMKGKNRTNFDLKTAGDH
nr:retrotransposon protein, putative, Ty1-copia subclass [Tanacetum cinerariifolium]